MSDSNTSWFHCGRCGTLFRSPVGELDDRLCTECGSNPSLGIDAQPATIPQPRTTVPSDRDEPRPEREKHSHRRRRGNGLMVKLITIWVLFIALVIWGARVLWPDEIPTSTPVAEAAKAAEAISDEDVVLLNEGAPKCDELFNAYLQAGTPEQRNQFVLSPITTAPRIARFYNINQVSSIDPATVTIKGRSVVHLPGRKAIESQLETSDGRLLDEVFVQDNGDWKLDWEHHVRYSDIPWALYLAGSGEDVTEFRLLARERLVDERKDHSDISVVLYAPRFGFSNETGFASPEFLISRASENGRKLETAFKLERSGKRPFGVRLPSINPEGLIRVRVKVRRVVENMERRFELVDVIVCHWYSTDEPGMEIPAQREGK